MTCNQTIQSGSNIPVLNTVQALRTFNNYQDEMTVIVLGNLSFADGDGGIYTFDSTSTLADDGINTIQPTSIASGTPGRYILTNLNSSADGLVTALKAQYASASGASLIGYQYDSSTNVRTVQNRLRDSVSVKDFGAKGDGSTDDTIAFRTAISNIISNGGGTLYVPHGHYVLSSSFDTSTGQNSILPLPLLTDMVTLRIVGEGALTAFSGTPLHGTTISTPNTFSAGNFIPSIIGYNSSSSTWNMLSLVIEDIGFMVPTDSNITAIDATYLANCSLENVSVYINENSADITAPSSTTFTAIKLPTTGNYGIVKAKNIYVSGFYYGIEHSEHADIEALINSCVYALYIPTSYSHLAKYKVTTQYCSYSIRCSGQANSTFAFSNSIFGTLDIERDPNFQFDADFYIDSGAILNGILWYNVAADPQSLYSVWGSGTFNVSVQNLSYSSLTVSTSTTVNPNGMFYPVIPNGLTSDITLTIRQGLVKGQRIRIYSYYAYNVQVNSIVSTGSPAFYFPDNSKTYSYTLNSGNGSAQYIELVWSGQDWFASTEGYLVVNNASSANNAMAYGQFTGNVQNTFSPTVNSQEQNAYNCPISLYIQFTIPAGGTATLRMGPYSGSLLDCWSQTVPSGGNSVETTGTIRVPANWYYEVYTTSGVTLGQSLSVQI